jgi:hypothetical protein
MVFGFAVVLTFAGVDAVAVYGGVSGLSLSHNTSKHGSGGHCEGGTSSSGFEVHFCILMIGSEIGLNGVFSLDIALE